MQALSTRSEVAKLLPIFPVSLGPCYVGDSNLVDLSFVLTLLEPLIRINVKFTVKTSFMFHRVISKAKKKDFFTEHNILIFPKVVKWIHSPFTRKSANPFEVQLFLPIFQDTRFMFTTS